MTEAVILEPACETIGVDLRLDERLRALASIAISLKRIADTLEAMRTEPVNEYGAATADARHRAVLEQVVRRAGEGGDGGDA